MSHFAALTYETLPWVSHLPPDLISHRAAARIPTTYQAAMPAEIAAARFALESDLAATAEQAAQAIMRLDALASRSVGGHAIAPLASVLLRTESAASSQIEHVTVGARQLAIAELGLAASANAELVAGNVSAMRAAIALADRMDADAILAMHRALMASLPQALPGQWRDRQVWIGSSGLSPAGAAFVPPAAGRVPAAMADLVGFLGRADLPILVQAAIAHAQFETIHPFVDGNGRTGRALMHAMLRSGGATQEVTVPVSAGLLCHVNAYVEALTAYRQGDIRPVVETVATAAEESCLLGHWLLGRLTDLITVWQETARPRAGSGLAELIYLVVGQPAVTVASVGAALRVSPTAALRAVHQAASRGILTPASDKRRNRVWLAQDVLALLDDFAARAPRRSG